MGKKRKKRGWRRTRERDKAKRKPGEPFTFLAGFDDSGVKEGQKKIMEKKKEIKQANCFHSPRSFKTEDTIKKEERGLGGWRRGLQVGVRNPLQVWGIWGTAVGFKYGGTGGTWVWCR